ncbi:hypothetical protein J4429_05300 [Candidatus Pacearchaeota archaeon]|nr:hypothetical protein [Candidatus Pacearchaeota archaeon]
MKKIKWTNLEKKLLNSLENIHDEDFLKLLKKYKIDIELGNPPYNSDEKLLGAIGLITDTPRKKIIEEIKKRVKIKEKGGNLIRLNKNG